MIYFILGLLVWIVCGVVGWYFSGIHKQPYIDGQDLVLVIPAIFLGPISFFWILMDASDDFQMRNPLYRKGKYDDV